MITRRTIAAAAAGLILLTLPAVAEDWKARYPELTLAVVPNENAAGTLDRFTPLAAYLATRVGVPVKLRVVSDYAGVIEGQRDRTIHIAFYGAASFSRAVMTGVKIQPIVTQIHQPGVSGYHSVIYVLAAGPYASLDDLKGKTLALVDPDSTSGNQAPRFFLKRAGYDVDTHFGKTFFAGSHESAVLALTEGRADAAANLWNAETDTMVTRMAVKGLLKKPDGTPMQQSDFRVVFKSDFLPEGPFAMLASLPEDLKAEIRRAFLDLPKADKAVFDRLSDGKDLGLTPVTLKDYQPVIDMLKANDEPRKRT
ncbi:phosphonate ABC transporter substrate-binding protein [Methylobacterium pseudosasicola]|uniref:Phosphonate transport system substrate-binding protein n=1 Tax=Methylobacterium pseudosasicola TaxID=582667 RepID=A0A1I4F0Z0_9HYPH|nr:phosphonate ABC transporter substrate-binding protein [Methylobacterium pseudosasicola]SFL11219.1 phosphonate transport system substrate-binding protein [Methylobacterium pseudosasicola]